MAGASLFLPFLPLLPKQTLLAELLTDVPETAIAIANVDPSAVAQLQRRSQRLTHNVMLVFGLVSSVFGYLMFGVLLLVHVSPEGFRAGWFVESVISPALIVLVSRTSGPFYKLIPSCVQTYGVWRSVYRIRTTPYAIVSI